MKFRDENESQDESQPNGSDFMQEIRDLLSKGGSDTNLSDDDIKAKFGAETLGMVVRVQERIDLLVDTMHEFLAARDSGDGAAALSKFTRLMQETVVKYSPMEVGSMLSSGITAIAELERRFGKPGPDTE